MNVTDRRQQATQVVISFIEGKGPIPGATLADKLTCAYLDQGILDSMQLVELVITIERHFGFRLGPAELQSEAFRTVGGVIETVLRRVP